MANIHFWDMDHTLIENDCDVSWKEFLLDQGLAPGDTLELADNYWRQYEQGILNVGEFFDFQLREFKDKSPHEMRALAQKHYELKVEPKIYPQAVSLLNELKKSSTPLCLITSTNRILAEPLAKKLDFHHLFATDLEIGNNRFTGKILGSYCGGSGKIPYIQHYCDENKTKVEDCFYYGDSLNDIPIFNFVGFPMVVNPNQELKKVADQNGWKVLKFKLNP